MSKFDFIAITYYNDCNEIKLREYLIMASLTIRRLDDDIKQKLRLQAAKNGRSMEAEARAIFTQLFTEQKKTVQTSIASRIQQIVKQHNLDETIELPLPERKNNAISQRKLDFSDEAYG